MEPALQIALAVLNAAPQAMSLLQSARADLSANDQATVDAAIAAAKEAALADVAAADGALDAAAKT